MPVKHLRRRVGRIAVLVAAALAFGHPLVAQGLQEKDVKREFGYITLRDGVKLSYVTYRPMKEGKYPVLLEFSPYGVDGTPFSNAVKQYLDRGYAYAGVDIRGTSCSTGTLSMFDPIIAPDGAEVVEWVGSRSWADGVGMIGVSYPGHTQIFTASARPKYLKAIAPGALTASGYREAWRPAGMFNQSFIGGWAFTDRDEAARRRADWGDKECNLENAKTYTRKTYYEVLQHPTLDEAHHIEAAAGDAEVIAEPEGRRDRYRSRGQSGDNPVFPEHVVRRGQ